MSGNLSERIFLFLELGLVFAVSNTFNYNHRIKQLNERTDITNCDLVVVKVVLAEIRNFSYYCKCL